MRIFIPGSTRGGGLTTPGLRSITIGGRRIGSGAFVSPMCVIVGLSFGLLPDCVFVGGLVVVGFLVPGVPANPGELLPPKGLGILMSGLGRLTLGGLNDGTLELLILGGVNEGVLGAEILGGLKLGVFGALILGGLKEGGLGVLIFGGVKDGVFGVLILGGVKLGTLGAEILGGLKLLGMLN